MWLLRSRRSFRHQDQQNLLMSYLYVICVIWHKMSYYDEWRIWKNCLKIKILKNALQIFSLYKFWKSFVFSAETVIKSGHRRNHLSAIFLVFLGFPDLIQWQNTWARIANPIWVFLDHPTLPYPVSFRCLFFLSQSKDVLMVPTLSANQSNTYL